MLTKKMFFKGFPTQFSILMISALLIGSLAFPRGAQALGFAIEVDTTADNNTWDGLCSLREAINNANFNAASPDCTTGGGADGIFFSDTLGTATIILGSPLPNISDPAGLLISGGSDITISGNNAFQVFVIPVSSRLTLKGLTVRNGKSSITLVGGAIFNVGTLSIDNCTFISNNALVGGAIANALTGRITITNSNFLSNSADNNGGGIYNEGGVITINNGDFVNNTAILHGGGIFNTGNPNGTINIAGTSFTGNFSNDAGGGIYNASANPMNITDADFIENESNMGGGIYNDSAALTITRTNFTSNISSDAGGGIYNASANPMNITDANFIENESSMGGGIYNDNGTLTITGSSLSKNLAGFGAGIYSTEGTLYITSSDLSKNFGDGIFNKNGYMEVIQTSFEANIGNGIYNLSDSSSFSYAELRVTNSSFIKNFLSGIHNNYAKNNIFTTTFYGNGYSGIYNTNNSLVTISKSTFQLNSARLGGGIHNNGSILHILNSTFSGNTAWKGGGVYNNGQAYVLSSTFSDNWAKLHDGLYNGSSGAVRLYNTIIANGGNSGDDCRNDPGGTVAGNNNLIEALSGDACGLVDGIDGNIVGLDPELGALAGSPAYYPLNSGSPALDAGDDAQCAAVSNQSQNGVPRPQGAHCDIGSYEAPVEVVMSTPQEAVMKLSETVKEMAYAGAISVDDDKVLVSMLDASIDALVKGDTESGIKALNSFIDEVAMLIKSGKLKSTYGQPLIDGAQAVIDSLY